MANLSTLRTTSYTTCYNHLNAGTYKITNYNNIHPSYNDLQLKQEGFPQVIIRPPKISVKKNTIGGDIKEAIVDYTIEVRHSSAANMRTVMDEVSNKIRTGVPVFTAANFYPLEEPKDNYDEIYFMPNKTMHLGTVYFTFKFIGSDS